MFINTNIAALDAQRNLLATSNVLQKSVERLSSGLRINRAADDAAGLSISEKLRSQIAGLGQASRNAQDGISMIQTAEGALNEVDSMLQRMRELAVQSSNDTLTSDDRATINLELQQLKEEVNGISGRTTFNGKQLLTGSLQTQLGGTTGANLVTNDTITNGGESAVVTQIDVANARAGETYNISVTGASVTLTRASDGVAQSVTLGATAANGTQVADFSALGVKVTYASTVGITGANAAAGLLANTSIVTAAGSGAANYQIGANSSDAISVSFGKVDISAGASAGLVSLNTALTNYNVTQDVTNSQALISAVDAALVDVNNTRSTLGAVQNRLEHTIANLGVTQENLTASESRIRDTDMAAEMVKFTKTQVLQQAGTAVLAQANQIPQSIMTLLR